MDGKNTARSTDQWAGYDPKKGDPDTMTNTIFSQF